MLSLRHISTSLHAHWAQLSPEGVPTVFPGVFVDTSGATDWIEVWLDMASEQPHRQSSPSRVTLFLTVHCFSRDRHDTLRAESLCEAVTDTLARTAIPVVDPQQPAVHIGLLQTTEPEIRNLSRLHAAKEGDPLQHLVVTLTGTATDFSN